MVEQHDRPVHLQPAIYSIFIGIIKVINYEITRADPLTMQFHIVYSKEGFPDYVFANALPPEYTEEMLHDLAKEHALFAADYWVHWENTKDNAVEFKNPKGQTKSIIREVSPDYDTLTEKLEEVVTEDDETVTYSYKVVPCTVVEKAAAVRQKRLLLLLDTDRYGLVDRGTAQEWLDYRQALRDIPQQEGFPVNVTWPIKPLEG